VARMLPVKKPYFSGPAMSRYGISSKVLLQPGTVCVLIAGSVLSLRLDCCFHQKVAAAVAVAPGLKLRLFLRRKCEVA